MKLMPTVRIPLIGFGSDSAAYGTAAASIWTFMNQTGTPLEEELTLLRGGSFFRPPRL